MKRNLVLLIIIAFSIGTKAQQKLSLNQCIELALENSSKIKNANLDQQKAEYKIKEVIASGLPQVNAYGEFNDQLDIPAQILPGELAGQPGTDLEVEFGKQYNMNGGIQTSQLLYSQSYFVGVKAAKSSRELYALLTKSTQEQIIYEVTSQYLSILSNEQQLNSLRANSTRLEELKRVTDLMVGNQLAKSTDAKRIQVNMANLNTKTEDLKAGIVFQKNYLKVIIGKYDEEQIGVDSIGIAIDRLVNAIGEKKFSTDNRTESSILNKQIGLRELELKSIKSGYLPTLSAFHCFGYNAQSDEFDLFDSGTSWYKQNIIGLKLNVPIFDGFQKRSKSKQAKLGVQQSKNELENSMALMNAQFMNARLNVSNSFNSLMVQQKNKELANEVYQETELQYKEGLARITDMLDAETAWRESVVNYNAHQFSYQLANLDLLKARGELNMLIDKK